MAKTRKIPIPIAPGIILRATEYEAQGRFVDCDHVRFADGQPEKIGGWEQWNTPGDELPNTCRTFFSWQDFSYNVWHGFGTSSRLWVFRHDKERTNITPWQATGSLTDPFDVTSGETTVVVNDTAHGLVVGQYVVFSGATAVGGITINGEYPVTGVIDADSYEIEHGSAASGTATGGGTVGYSYELPYGNENVTFGGGYGLGPYGEGTYGTERSSATYVQLPRLWSMDRYGQYLLAMPTGGTLYQWTLNTANRAAAVSNAPATGLYMFVTSERMVVVLGADGDFMTLKWCDDDDNTVWTPSASNTASARKLQQGSRLVCGAALAQGINLVWSDTSIYLMQFTGDTFVYSTRVVGTNCGIVGPTAFCVVDGIAFWMTQRMFYMFSGALQQIPRWDEIAPIFDDIDETQRFKVICHYNPEFREVWWHYPSSGAAEPDKYVMVNIDTWEWSIGTMDRTAMGVRTLVGETTVMGVDSTGIIYEHETGTDDDGDALPWHLESAYFDIDSGNRGVIIDGYIPDFKRQTGDITMTLTSKDLPEDTATLDTATKTIAEGDTIVDVRHFGRQCRIRFEQDEIGGDFRLGAHRLEVGGSATKRSD